MSHRSRLRTASREAALRELRRNAPVSELVEAPHERFDHVGFAHRRRLRLRLWLRGLCAFLKINEHKIIRGLS